VGNSRAGNTADFGKFDIIISTYGSLLNDIEFLKDFKFNYVILDESQAIKNPNSKRYKAVRLLNSYNRLVLTGTPIENNTFDLYAQLNFLNPGLLGNISHFKNNFSDAIDKEKNVETSVLLGKIISPFLLRRTKENVAKELPEKTESIIYCEMEPEQRKVYEAYKNKYRDYLLNKIDENGAEKSQMYILEGLTKLRQICNSTALTNDEEDYGNYSAKLEILIENIKEKTGNHKILVFSQFVKMLQIVKERLDEENISYEYLDGKTKNRQDNVNNFQSNEKIRVFLISLKAGGTGLNLTEADYVFIIDPWWNPAVENQAIDRCYRIGQTKNVLAYRMICKDTIEEKIVSLQLRKKAVATGIISIDEDKKSFNINEVKELFK
jgi:SNF2 family DNA or RNA helicase